MRRVLIVSPSFPPISAADGQRVRMSLRHYREFGWDPHVLAIEPHTHGGLTEPELLSTIPADVQVARCGGMPESATKWLGIRTPGLRAWPSLYRAGASVIRRDAIDLVYFSTTMFPVVTLGRIWKRRFGTPFVVDFQDPWHSDYDGRGVSPGFKARAARWLNARTEPFAMRAADGVIAVSPAYAETLQRRYRNIRPDMCATIPFGASDADAQAAGSLAWTNAFFHREPGRWTGVSVGRGGRDLQPAADLLFEGLSRATTAPQITLNFIGTDYAREAGRQTLAPRGAAFGLTDRIREFPERVPYLQSLRILADADFTIILGSDDPSYSPSKIYPYLLCGRPFVAVMHRASPAVPILQRAGTGVVVTFGDSSDRGAAVDAVKNAFEDMPHRASGESQLPESIRSGIDARSLTRLQCAAFDAAVGRSVAEVVACAE
jgi:hypothetical protein